MSRSAYYRSLIATAEPLLLDTIVSPEAYSLQRISNSYTGHCIRVRRSSDNAVLDVGFIDNALDTAAILSFCGAGNGFVVRIYNQGTLGGFIERNGATREPQIVATGSMITEGGLPALTFNGANGLFKSGAFNLLQNKSSASIYSVYRYTSNPTTYRAVISVSIFAAGGFPSAGQRMDQAGGGVSNRHSVAGRRLDANTTQTHSGTVATTTSARILNTSQIDWANSNAHIYINGVLDSTNTTFLTDGNTSNTTSRGLTIGGIEGGTVLFAPAQMRWQETIIVEDMNNQSVIESNINSRYSIY